MKIFMFNVKTSNHPTLFPVFDSLTCSFIHIITLTIQLFIEHNRCVVDLARFFYFLK